MNESVARILDDVSERLRNRPDEYRTVWELLKQVIKEIIYAIEKRER